MLPLDPCGGTRSLSFRKLEGDRTSKGFAGVEFVLIAE